MSDSPTIWCRVTDGARTVGDITVQSDGTFVGKITDERFLAVMQEILVRGLADQVLIGTDIQPAERLTNE